MKQVLFIAIPILLLVTLFANSQTKMSRKEYIDTYKAISIREMHRSGIPASITMAQACLESSNGNSSLTRKSNNHFGIKCRNDWKGARVYHNDDKLNECFRKYRTAEESYIDHSDFLVQNPRYQSLFTINSKDYKTWARGLKKAGYATDPNYPSRLIKIIEDEKLYLLDLVSPEELARDYTPTKKETPNTSNDLKNSYEKTKDQLKKGLDNIKINPGNRREVKILNGLTVIYANSSDTYENIAREFEMKTWEIYLYNDLPKDVVQPEANEVIYLERKRYNALKGNNIHTVKARETMRLISQKYGIKLSRLYRLNRMKKGEKPIAGDSLYLRKMRPKND
jgi:LysM repeat protein